MTVSVRAPGKLFVAGEYAVVESGEPAVLVAIDRFLTVHVDEAAEAGSVHSPERGGEPLTWTRRSDGSVHRDATGYDYVVAALELVEQLRAARGIAPRYSSLRIESDLADASGRKFGLGSSSAVTVATVDALGRFHGLDLTRREVYQLAMLATARLAPLASGGDLAAAAFGGWLRYRAPDRSRILARLAAAGVADTLADEDAWEGFEVTPLPAPAGLELVVGWTGDPASTNRLVDGVRGRVAPEVHATFVAASRVCVDSLCAAIRDGDADGVLAALRTARALLGGLGAAAGLPIETEHLAALCDAAEVAGAAGKPSGAGGGDCGIVLAPADADLAGMLRSWESHDIRRLTVAVHAYEEVSR